MPAKAGIQGVRPRLDTSLRWYDKLRAIWIDMRWKRFSRFRMIITLAALLSIPVGLLYTQRQVLGFQSTLVTPVIDVTLAIQSGFASMIGSLTDKLFALSAAFDSQDELVELRAKTEESRALKLALIELEAENLRLKELVDFSAPFTGSRIVGSHVIGRTGAPLSRTFQIDKGREHGVRRGDAVVSSSGAVGQVLMTGKYYSDVLLLTDSSSAVDVIVQRTRARGLLKGGSSSKRYSMKVNDFDRLHEVNEGDVVVTSGMGAHFPAGVPVGEIVALKQTPDSLYIQAEVKPFTRFDRLEEVMVLTDGGLQKPWNRDDYMMEKLGLSVAPLALKRK